VSGPVPILSLAARDETDEPPAPPTPAQATESEGIDLVLLAAALALLVIGIVCTYSASAVYAARETGTPYYFVQRELGYGVVGVIALCIAARTDFGAWRRWVYPALAVSFVLLVAVLFIGHRVGPARRWFRIGPASLEPAELAKLSLVAYLSYSLAKKAEKIKTFTVGFLPHLAVCAVFMALVLKQPDLGTACILGATTLALLFVAGAKVSYILIALLGAAPVVYQAIVGTGWRLQRIRAFIDPWLYRQNIGYQTVESLLGLGSGGLWGTGLGDGKQKLFMPESHTDFIMAVVGEELGLIGVALVLALFGVIVWRGLRTAARAREPFGAYLATGLTAMFALQAIVNVGVVLNVLPTKGITLPFVSYGGTSLVTGLFAIGVLLNISSRAPAPQRRRLGVARVSGNRRRRPTLQVVVVPPGEAAPGEVG
jgi:cell division protein FtsW